MGKEQTETKYTTKELKRRLDDNELDLSLMQIEKVPVEEIASLNKVTSLDLSCNMITCLPEGFASSLPKLVKLDLSKNQLTSLPNNVGKLQNLQRLDLYQNNIKFIPPSFSQLTKLKWLDLKDNPLDPSYSKIVGDCLDDQQCRKCARNLLKAVKEAASKLEIEKQNRIAEQKILEAKRKLEEQALLEKKRLDKKLEKERRRKEIQAQRAAERASEDKESDERDMSGADADATTRRKGGLGGFWMIIVVLLAAVAVGLWYYCDDDTSQYCVSYRNTIKRIGVIVEQYLEIFAELCVKIYRAGAAQIAVARVHTAHVIESVHAYLNNATKSRS